MATLHPQYRHIITHPCRVVLVYLYMTVSLQLTLTSSAEFITAGVDERAVPGGLLCIPVSEALSLRDELLPHHGLGEYVRVHLSRPQVD